VEPTCSCDAPGKAHSDLICTLLEDDGGGGYTFTFDHVREGLKTISRVKSGEIAVGYWSREALGADMTRNEVRISFVWDESTCATLTLEQFEIALTSWLDFIETPVRMDAHREVLL